MRGSEILEKINMSGAIAALFVCLVIVSILVSVNAAFSLGADVLEDDDEAS